MKGMARTDSKGCAPPPLLEATPQVQPAPAHDTRPRRPLPCRRAHTPRHVTPVLRRDLCGNESEGVDVDSAA